MGSGTPEDMLEAVKIGIDIFDLRLFPLGYEETALAFNIQGKAGYTLTLLTHAF